MRIALMVVFAGLSAVAGAQSPGHTMDVAATPAQMVATYETLADVILAANKTEWNLVHSILATTYSHAMATEKATLARLKAGESASAEIEKLATLVTQLANEGDAAVAAVRKRLVEGGHHHNSQGEAQGIYDEGFVIVTREARKGLLASATALAKLSSGGDAAALEAEWKKVEAQFAALHKNAK